MATLTDNMTMYMNAIGYLNATRTLYINGDDNQVNSYVYLMTRGGTAGTIGVDSSIPLYMPDVFAEGTATLFIKNTETEVVSSLSRTLFLKVDDVESDNSNLSLYVQNDAIDNSMTLVISTDGETDNAIPYNRGITLYLVNTDSPPIVPEVDPPVAVELNSYMTLFMRNAVADTDSMDLTIIGSEPLNSYAALSMTGMIQSNDSLDLYITSDGDVDSYMTLICYNQQGDLNSYINMYVAGGTNANDSMDLFMPVAAPDNNFAPLYVFGWG